MLAQRHATMMMVADLTAIDFWNILTQAQQGNLEQLARKAWHMKLEIHWPQLSLEIHWPQAIVETSIVLFR